ncbi:MAG: hypothetical protein AB1608_10190 [Thermoproteota archaeon]
MQKNFLRKLWWDGRVGHTTYLMFVLTFVNFILITYSFLIEQNEIFEKFISDLWLFVIIFIIIYFPVSILIGSWHTKTQISVEKTIKQLEDPLLARMIRTLLDVQTGKATKEEIEEFRKMISEIEKRDYNEY